MQFNPPPRPVLLLAVGFLCAFSVKGTPQASELVETTVCTMDENDSAPLGGSAVEVFLPGQPTPAASGATDATGCVTLGVEVSTSIEGEPGLPGHFVVSSPYPNPVARRTVIPFFNDRYQTATAELYDLRGRRLASSAPAPLAPGQQSLEIDAVALPAGVYFYRIQGEHGTATGRFVKAGGPAGGEASLAIRGAPAGAPAPKTSAATVLVIKATHAGYMPIEEERTVEDGAVVNFTLQPVTTPTCSTETTDPVALDLMDPTDCYYGLHGGLTANGQPTVTPTNGKIVIISVSMSNGYQEFARLIELYAGHPDVAPEIKLVNCAVGGSALERWVAEASTLWDDCKTKVVQEGHSVDQVKVVWAKDANQFTDHGRTLPDPAADYYDLVTNIAAVSQRAGAEFPSIQAIFHTSRIYGGYVEEIKQAARGEPMTYEGGFAVNAVIEMQQRGELPGAPWVGWGPYLWADGTTPNGSGIFWETTDFQGTNGDNQHPSQAGQTKVADALHAFFMQFDWYRN